MKMLYILFRIIATFAAFQAALDAHEFIRDVLLPPFEVFLCKIKIDCMDGNMIPVMGTIVIGAFVIALCVDTVRLPEVPPKRKADKHKY